MRDIYVVGCLESYSFVYLLFCENLVSREHWVEEPAHVVGIEKYGFGEKRRVYGVQNRDGDCQVHFPPNKNSANPEMLVNITTSVDAKEDTRSAGSHPTPWKHNTRCLLYK